MSIWFDLGWLGTRFGLGLSLMALNPSDWRTFGARAPSWGFGGNESALRPSPNRLIDVGVVNGVLERCYHEGEKKGCEGMD